MGKQKRWACGSATRGLVLVGAFAVTSCTAEFRNHGYAPSDAQLSEVLVGVDTRASVEDVIGRPTSEGIGPQDGFYYVESTWRHFAWQQPRPIDRQVVVISFDGQDVVSNVERFTLEDGRVVPLSRRVTDSPIQSSTFLRQLLGAASNFNPGQFLGDG